MSDQDWLSNIDPLALHVEVYAGGGRCRVEVWERTGNPERLEPFATFDVSERPTRDAARQAFRLLAEQMAHFQARAGR